jgi:hypothetical protein
LSCPSLGLTRPVLSMASCMARPHRKMALSGVKVPSSLRACTGTVSARRWRNRRSL